MEFPQVRKHSEQIGGLVQDMIRSTDTSLDAIAISGGPGSYTGLRIGSSLAKGLCLGLEIPLVAVNSLVSCAWKIFETGDYAQSPLLSIFPSRDSEVYIALVKKDDVLSEIATAAIPTSDLEKWLAKIEIDKPIVLGPGADLNASYISELDRDIEHIQNVTSTASSVAILGEMRLNSGLIENIESYEPDYLKPFVAKQGTPIFERLEKNRKKKD